MEYEIKLTKAEVQRLLIVLNAFADQSPTVENLFNEISNQTTVKL